MSEKKYFGTDGIRGLVGQYPINAEFVLKLGWAVGRVLGNKNKNKVLIGKDTRISGYMFESALESGLAAAGVDSHLLGPMPTPAIAYLTRTLRAQAGVVISASHNSFQDNGIKFFSPEGIKLDDVIELQIETLIDQPMETVDSKDLGKAMRVHDAPGRYIEFCKSTIPPTVSLRGLKIVIDSANGATYHIAPHVFSELGAKVVSVGASPDGLNINAACGSTAPQLLQQTVLQQQADLGIALDGDGDRVIMVDHKGELVDGDELVYIIAKDRFSRDKLWGNGIVGTQMSNFGLECALQTLGIEFIRTLVGDRYVLAALKKRGWHLGGESSGHIICLDKTTTGDGIISALQVLRAMCMQEKKLHELKSGMNKLPQCMVNVKLQTMVNAINNKNIDAAVMLARKRLNGKGRVLLRPSGTEPIVRVMVEGENTTLVNELANDIADVVRVSLLKNRNF